MFIMILYMFRALYAHHQEVEFYWCSIWYRHFQSVAVRCTGWERSDWNSQTVKHYWFMFLVSNQCRDAAVWNIFWLSTNEWSSDINIQDLYFMFMVPCIIIYSMNNQQMQLYAVSFIPLLGSLYMFPLFYTPIIRSTIFNCIYSYWYKP